MAQNDNALVVADKPTGGPMTLAEVRSLAQAFHLSGMFPDVHSEAQALVKIQAGVELGMPPVFSMTHIYIVKGRVMTGAAVLGAALKRSGRYDYHVIEHDDRHCVIEFTDRGEMVYRSIWTMDDARRAGVVKPDSAWSTYPRAMLFARALSAGVGIVAPETKAGIYAIEEFGGCYEGGRVLIPPEVADEPTHDTTSDHVATATADRTAELREKLSKRKQDSPGVASPVEHTGAATKPISPSEKAPGSSTSHQGPPEPNSPVRDAQNMVAAPIHIPKMSSYGDVMSWARTRWPARHTSDIWSAVGVESSAQCTLTPDELAQQLVGVWR